MAATSKARGSAHRQGASRRGSSATPANGWRWYSAGLLSGIFVSFMAYLVLLPPAPREQGGRAAADSAEAVAPAQQPRFDFFDVLPQQNIEVDVDPAQIAASRSSADAGVYLLQAGSFRQAADADRRRAELLLLGLEPRVEEVDGSNGRWFRVLLGPFESRSRMAAARSMAAQQNIETLLVKRGGPP